MDFWNKGTLKSLLAPGGAILVAAFALLASGVLSLSPAAVDSYYYVVFIAGILLAWRSHSSRILFALITLLLAHRALEFFSSGRVVSTGPGRIALEAVALLLPLNYILLSWARERGLGIPAIVNHCVVLFLESVFVAVLSRPGSTSGPAFLHVVLLPAKLLHFAKVPQIAWIVFGAAILTLLLRFLLYRKPVESGLLWSLIAAFVGLEAGGSGRMGSAYFATAGLILASSMVENFYVLAYHDELTSLPARRAFNDAVLRLKDNYTVAVVDIDHFKNFNDTYGHDTGDQVLRMVATRLAHVSGGGQAFRVGGEEFTILFAGESLKDALPHLEILRMEIEASAFRTRGTDRRVTPHGTDRRKVIRGKPVRLRRNSPPVQPGELYVTVSIGVAEPTARLREVEQIIQAADKALYRAKKNGRNRVETDSAARSKPRRNIA